jgi:hypothetical protein
MPAQPKGFMIVGAIISAVVIHPMIDELAVLSTFDALTNGDHAGFRAKVRALALDYADQVALDYASFLANF